MKYVIGIDLGTTYSVVAYVNEKGKAEVIHNEFQHATTPSLIYFGAEGPIVGEKAKEQQKAGKTEIAAFFKRSLDDENFLLTFYEKNYTAVDLSALVLAYLKKQAERHFQEEVTDAVITVPAYFTHVQRQATIRAGEQAGLHVVKIINEPTAAALAYVWREQQEGQLVLVYDLGGGTFDVSLMEIRADGLQGRAIEGDHRLGGKDWDDRLLRHIAEQIMQDCNCELSESEIEALRFKVERAKQALTLRQSASVTIPTQNKTYTFSRILFEELTRDLLERTQALTETALRSASKQWSDVDGVLLVGGSTRMPMIRDAIERVAGKPALTGCNPDEAVALGAAIQASIESKQASTQATGRKTPIDVIGHSLGTIAGSADQSHYINSIIIEKNMPLPITRTRSFEVRIRADGQTKLEVFLTQGESEDLRACTCIGHYIFSNFTRSSQPTEIVDITYEYDSNSIVHVSAREQRSGRVLTSQVEAVPADVIEFYASKGQQHEKQPLTVYLAVDLSISMDGQHLDMVKKAAIAFVRCCDFSRMAVGLVSFSDATLLDLAATNDEKALRRSLERLSACSTGQGNNGQPFDELYDALASIQGPRHAIIVTDGAWAYRDKAISQARRCQQAGIEISAIGFDKANRDFLACIASQPDNCIFSEIAQLPATFQTLAQKLTGVAGGAART